MSKKSDNREEGNEQLAHFLSSAIPAAVAGISVFNPLMGVLLTGMSSGLLSLMNSEYAKSALDLKLGNINFALNQLALRVKLLEDKFKNNYDVNIFQTNEGIELLQKYLTEVESTSNKVKLVCYSDIVSRKPILNQANRSDYEQQLKMISSLTTQELTFLQNYIVQNPGQNVMYSGGVSYKRRIKSFSKAEYLREASNLAKMVSLGLLYQIYDEDQSPGGLGFQITGGSRQVFYRFESTPIFDTIAEIVESPEEMNSEPTP